MPKDPYAVLRALLRADAVRHAPKPEPRRGPAEQKTPRRKPEPTNTKVAAPSQGRPPPDGEQVGRPTASAEPSRTTTE